MATLYGVIWDQQDDYHRIPGDAGRETAPIEEQYHFVSQYTNFDVVDSPGIPTRGRKEFETGLAVSKFQV